jgi:hypothetical protein
LQLERPLSGVSGLEPRGNNKFEKTGIIYAYVRARAVYVEFWFSV